MIQMSINHPSYRVDDYTSERRYMAYDGDGIEVGYLTLTEARERFASATIDTETKTITIEG